MREKFLKKLLSTKLLWNLLILALSSLFYAVGKMESTTWVTVALTLSGINVGGNLGTKVVHAFAKNKEGK